ncbi:hypothetical protein H0H81_002389 [Sphagnurus paluster]|uniref:Elongation factor 1 alpha-like protein n=1 Tax=Sphagnurus paluster TaxID=117069 RepID=A0A9P7GPJ4_9AGAR|nr:hypothetical protein H0H81_002389 [Sphagnurus paluster]
MSPDELDDDALSDGGEEDMTDEQHARLLSGLEQIRQVLGDESVSGLSDKDIKDALWEFFFDEEKAIQWALEEQHKRRLAQERKDFYDEKELPPVPQEDEDGASNMEYYHPEEFADNEPGAPIERPRVPLVFLHQQPGSFDISEMGTPRVIRPVLSTISERTERTEPTPRHIGRFLTPHQTPRPPSTSFTISSYGELINGKIRNNLATFNIRLSIYLETNHPPISSPGPIDPNSIPISPSFSALNALSLFEPAPSGSESDVERITPHAPPSEPAPPSEGLPEIPDYNSKSSKQPVAPALPPKQSKLSLLASSRTGSVSSRSQSSRSSGTSLGSVKTFPALRPAAQSTRPSNSVASSSRSSRYEAGENAEIFNGGASSTSSHVRRAIETAMQLESAHKPAIQKPDPKTASPLMSSRSSDKTEPHIQLQPQSRASISSLQSSASPTVKQPPTHPYKEVDTFRHPSKLALLAQAKTSQRGPKVPKPVTEYLTPTANGPTATTAITTSYQTLYTLTDPTRSRVIPAQFVVPLGATPPVSPPEIKRSKLAAKIKKAHEKQYTTPLTEEEFTAPPISPIFAPKSSAHVRASPSAFASLLVDDLLISCEDKERSTRRREKEHKHQKESPLIGTDGPPEQPAKEREKILKKAAGTGPVSSSRPPSAMNTPIKKKPGPGAKKSGTSTPLRGMDPRQLDLSALNLTREESVDMVHEEPPKMNFAREKLLEEAKRVIEVEGEDTKKSVSLVVVGHVDAGKSTLMGRLLYELGRMEEKARIANERGSSKAGKSSFSWAWGLDGTTEERERGITMDIALQSLTTPHRQVTILDAPGHKDFIPNMISGASQADCALLVLDAANGQFEAGFERGGQTREHLLLVRSLGVAQVIVAINKLDQVDWDKDRYEDICSTLRPFLLQSGFHPTKTRRYGPEELCNPLTANDIGNLDILEPPARDITAPLRIPISNVFKSHGSGAAVSGRLCGGVVQVGERLRILPGDETAIVKSIEVDEDNAPWAAAGTNATLYLTSVDPVNLHIGSVLCSPTDLVPLATSFTARIIVFDIQVPITAGTSVELFHHSRDVPATLIKLLSTIDRASGKVLKANPRVLSKGTSAEVQISLRSTTFSGPAGAGVRPIPLEVFLVSKDMGRILIRRGGETIGAGIVLSIDA